MLDFEDFVFDKSGCEIQCNHRLPCACYMYIFVNAQSGLYLDDIYLF